MSEFIGIISYFVIQTNSTLLKLANKNLVGTYVRKHMRVCRPLNKINISYLYENGTKINIFVFIDTKRVEKLFKTIYELKVLKILNNCQL